MNSREIYCEDVNGGMAGVFADVSRYEVCHFVKDKMADNRENVNLQIRACFKPHRLHSVDAYASTLRRRERLRLTSMSRIISEQRIAKGARSGRSITSCTPTTEAFSQTA